MKKTVSIMFFVIAVLLLTVGCGPNMKKYDPLMNDAKAAIEQAKAAGANEYASDSLKTAEEAFTSAQASYENKKSEEVEKYANQAIELANKSKEEATSAKNEAERIIGVKNDYTQQLEELNTKIDEIKAVPEYYQKTQDLIEQAKAEFDAGEYDKALETLTLANDTFNKGLEIKNSKPASYKVVRGDCLWNIAKKEKIYGDPFRWPVIYKANKDKIRDPDLIYPRQVFKIPR